MFNNIFLGIIFSPLIVFAFATRFYTGELAISMHRIHHSSVIIKERNTNYGTIFSVWDRILGTLLKNVDQEGIRIGIGAYPRFEGVRLLHLLYMPFTKELK